MGWAHSGQECSRSILSDRGPTLYFSGVNARTEVYSPLQNAAVWLAAWLYGHESTDALVSALTDLGGDHHYAGQPLAHLLREIRSEADLDTEGPAVRLILSGPGQPPELPAGSPAAAALGEAGAVVIRGHAGANHILIPEYGDNGTQWRWFEEHERLPEPAWLSPGEADALLSRATNEAAVLIEAAGGIRSDLPNPRLTVGTLADFYDTPGLPMRTPPRAAKLFARADAVAAVVETVVDTLGDHSFDPHLFALWRHIRTARMAGVADAVLDYQRGD
nr:hypothetical protein [Corynebacterium sp. CCUG 69979]